MVPALLVELDRVSEELVLMALTVHTVHTALTALLASVALTERLASVELMVPTILLAWPVAQAQLHTLLVHTSPTS